MATRPEMTVVGDVYSFRWADEGISADVDRLTESRDGMHAEIVIHSDVHGLLHAARLNLLSTQSRGTMARALNERVNHVDWSAALEALCFLTLERYREGDPAIDLADWTPDRQEHWAVYPYLSFAGPTVLFAEGMLGKSMLALAIAYGVATGDSIIGDLRTAAGNVLYLDWESDDADLNRRAALLKAGLKLTAGLVLAYRYCSQPLVQIAPELRRLVVARNVSLVVIDSLGGACGGELEAPATALTFFNALRSLRASSLINAHTPKHEAGERQRSVFGSAFFTNLARSVWEVRSSRLPGEKGYSVGLFERKRNLSKPHEPIGLYLTYGEESTIIERQDVRDDPELAASLTQPERVVAALRRGKLTTAQLAEVTDASDGAMRKVMQRLHDKHLVQRFSDGWGLATHEDPT